VRRWRRGRWAAAINGVRVRWRRVGEGEEVEAARTGKKGRVNGAGSRGGGAGGRGWPAAARGRKGGAAVLEEEDGPDRWAPPVGG
jgi:hypothetical protein